MAPLADRYEIRKAGPDDAPGLAAFLRAAWDDAGPEGLGFAGATDEMIAELADLTTLTSILEDRDTAVWIVRRSGSVIAFAAAEAAQGPTAELSGIVVGHLHRGRGIGADLARHALSWAATRGASHMIVRTEPHNAPAIRFYESCGFAHAGFVEERVGSELLTVLELGQELRRSGGRRA